jgi:formylglycine-generating enzyme required for sulfatase activity
MFSWNDATAFCTKATAMMRQAKLIGDDELIRLPTEAEWEYCCRAGTTTAYSFGDEAQAPGDEGKKATLLDPYGWHTGNAAGNDPPVGALKPNAWGLYDMHGYLREFVADHWHPDYEGAPRTSAAWIDADETYSLRVVRGGSWRDWHGDLRSAARLPVPADACSDAIGLRCVKSKR